MITRLYVVLQNLDKSSLGPLRKAYCHSLNLLLRREVCDVMYHYVFCFPRNLTYTRIPIFSCY